MDSLYIILGVVLLVIVIGLLAYFTENGKQRHLNEQRKLAEQKRVDTIRVKYPDPEIQNKIINGSVWMGETKEQVIDSLGPPLDIDIKTTKTKQRETLKYNQVRANAYGTKIIIENGIVIGWEVK